MVSIPAESEVSLVRRVLGGSDVLILKEAGDEALFVSGFYPERLEGLGLSMDLYVSLGSAAYSELSLRFSPALRPVFRELSSRFPLFRSIIRDVRRACDRMAEEHVAARSEGLRSHPGSPEDVIKVVPG